GEAAVAGLVEWPQVVLQVLRTDEVEVDVAPALELLGEVLLAVVDEDVRPQLAAGLQLLRTAGGDRDGRSELLAQLDGEGADTARAAVDEHGLALADVGDHAQVRPHGAGDLDDRGRLGGGVALRDRHELALG